MTQEEKQLLLVDLCARLPYGVIGAVEHGREGTDYHLDFEQIDNLTHWQDVRERAAIAAMQGMLANPSKTGSAEEYVGAAIVYANALIEELKKK